LKQKGNIMTRYTLPDLPYDFSALEPHISGKIMELHHGKHHANYVKTANSVLDQLDEARQKDDFARLAALERALAFNLSGHILHSIFWKNLTPKGGGTPQGDFLAAIQKDFADFSVFVNNSPKWLRPSWVRAGPRWFGNPSGRDS